jgi:hypothetical protein
VAFVLSTASPWIAFISSLVSNEHASKGVLADETAGDGGDASVWALGGAGVSDFEQPDKAARRHANNERILLRITSGPRFLHSLCWRTTGVENESPFSHDHFWIFPNHPTGFRPNTITNNDEKKYIS